jgi:hypothetical protein
MMPNMVTAMVTVTVVGICEWDVCSILDEVGEHNKNTSESVLGRKLHQLCTHGKVQKRTDVVLSRPIIGEGLMVEAWRLDSDP